MLNDNDIININKDKAEKNKYLCHSDTICSSKQSSGDDILKVYLT